MVSCPAHIDIYFENLGTFIGYHDQRAVRRSDDRSTKVFSFDLRSGFLSANFIWHRRHGAGRKKKIAPEFRAGWSRFGSVLDFQTAEIALDRADRRVFGQVDRMTPTPKPRSRIRRPPASLPRQRRRSRVRRACVEVSRARPGAGDDGVAARPARGDKRGVGRHGTRGSGVGGDGDRASRAPPSSRQRIILLGPTARSLGLGHPALTPPPPSRTPAGHPRPVRETPADAR